MNWETYAEKERQRRLRELEYGTEPEKDDRDPWVYMQLSELYKTREILEASGEDPALLAKIKKILKDRGATR